MVINSGAAHWRRLATVMGSLHPASASSSGSLCRLPARSNFHGVTAETGLDALTHAVEAYIGRFYNTRETRSLTQQAVEAIYRMNRALGIPECFPCIRPEDLPQMAAWAEANPVYPMPVIFGKEDFIRVARRVMP